MWLAAGLTLKKPPITEAFTEVIPVNTNNSEDYISFSTAEVT